MTQARDSSKNDLDVRKATAPCNSAPRGCLLVVALTQRLATYFKFSMKFY